jgi:hypothetical protein
MLAEEMNSDMKTGEHLLCIPWRTPYPLALPEQRQAA